MIGLLAELKRRNVFRVAGVYLVVGWLLMQVASTLESAVNLPEWFDGVVTALVILGFPLEVPLPSVWMRQAGLRVRRRDPNGRWAPVGK
ncbi:MAG: hypothetical protein ACFB9M_00240 [Myxococcota bacterium]